MKTTSKIINRNLREYDSHGKVIHSKHSNGFKSWREYDSHGDLTHYKHSNGDERWYEYDSHGKLIHFKSSNGDEIWYDSNGTEITKKQFDKLNQSCDGKIIEVDGKKYRLTLV